MKQDCKNNEFMYVVDYERVDGVMLFKGKKTKRTSEDWDETLEWMQKLPLDTRVEL